MLELLLSTPSTILPTSLADRFTNILISSVIIPYLIFNAALIINFIRLVFINRYHGSYRVRKKTWKQVHPARRMDVLYKSNHHHDQGACHGKRMNTKINLYCNAHVKGSNCSLDSGFSSTSLVWAWNLIRHGNTAIYPANGIAGQIRTIIKQPRWLARI